jgi:hypothetical protein
MQRNAEIAFCETFKFCLISYFFAMPRQALIDAPGALHHMIVRESNAARSFSMTKTVTTELSVWERS